MVPLVLLYSRHPVRERRGLQEIFLGQKEQPGLIRKLFAFFQGYSDAVLEVGEPLDLQRVLPELSTIFTQRRKQIFELRRELIDSVDNIKKAIVGPTLKSKLELKEIILHHPRLETFMQRRARSSNQEIWKVRMEADKYLEEIAANYNYTLIQLAEKVLEWMWNNLFDGIEVDNDSLQKVKQAARHNTLVYVPCHKSHTDYLILSSILFQNKLSLPFVAAGKNLAFWPLGPFFRRGGAFFIRRSFKGMKFYAEVFSLYVKTMVQLGHNIEFFIEGGRSRTGKMVLPKLGLLAILIQAVEEGFCDDLVFRAHLHLLRPHPRRGILSDGALGGDQGSGKHRPAGSRPTLPEEALRASLCAVCRTPVTAAIPAEIWGRFLEAVHPRIGTLCIEILPTGSSTVSTRLPW